MYIKGSYIKPSNIISYVPPYIVQQPIGGTIGAGSSYTFKIKAKGTRNLTYKWFKNSSEIIGANSDTFSITNATGNDQANYYCEVSNNRGTVQSNIVFLTVNVAVQIVTQPTSVIVNPTTTTSFKISATGSDPIIYKWYKNNVLIPAVVTNSYYISNAQNSDVANYYCVASNILNTVTSNEVSLSLNKGITVVKNLTNITLNAKQTLNDYLSCTGTFPITAQWRKNNINYKPQIITNNGKVDLFILLDKADEGKYDCVLTNIVGSITSSPFNIYVNTAPFITVQPVNITQDVNKSVTITYTVTGTQPFTFAWYKDNVNTGIKTQDLTIPSLEITDAGTYKCTISNIVATVTTNSVSLNVNSTYLITRSSEYVVFKDNAYWNVEK